MALNDKYSAATTDNVQNNNNHVNYSHVSRRVSTHGRPNLRSSLSLGAIEVYNSKMKEPRMQESDRNVNWDGSDEVATLNNSMDQTILTEFFQCLREYTNVVMQ